jgi:peptide-methionine (S)-S-oxide reductase
MAIQPATFAAGCFWGVEEIIRKIPGVLKTTVGYTGGKTPNPIYNTVKTGTTGHAEAIQIEFDSDRLTYDELLVTFFRLHDPTTPNRQGNDVGSQYRSAVFYSDETQKAAAENAKLNASKSGLWKKPIVTEIIPLTQFWDAEAEHQDYLQRNPNGYNCHYLR